MIKYYLTMDYEKEFFAFINKMEFPTEEKALEAKEKDYEALLKKTVEATTISIDKKTNEIKSETSTEHTAVELPSTLYTMLDSLMPEPDTEPKKNDKNETLEPTVVAYQLDKASFDKLIVLTNKIALFNNAQADFIRATTIKDMKAAGKKAAYIRKAATAPVKENGLTCIFPVNPEEAKKAAEKELSKKLKAKSKDADGVEAPEME